VTEEKLAVKLEKVAERLRADAPNMRRPGADLIAHYLDPDRLAVQERWSRRHVDTQRRLCERFAAPVIDEIACKDIKTGHMQRIVNAAPTAGEGDRVHRLISALVTAGIDAGYLVSSRLAKVHWQAGNRGLPAPAVSVAGEAAPWVDPAEIPSDDDVGMLGLALSEEVRGDRDELMANTAAYSGLRYRRRPQGRRSRRAPLSQSAEEPEAPQDHLPAVDARRLPAGRASRRPDR